MTYCENCFGKKFSFEEYRNFILNEGMTDEMIDYCVSYSK